MNVNEHKELLFPAQKRVKTKVQMYLIFIYFQNKHNYRKCQKRFKFPQMQ
jgi:hypothetical protein